MPKKQLLLVDGDAKSLSVMEVSLRNAGFSVTTAVNGQDALDKIRLRAPDLVVSDTKLPEIDGFELCRRLKSDEKLAHVPFVFLTSQKSVADKVRGLELGADDYLTKPIYIKEIVTRAKLVLQRREKEQLERKGPLASFMGNLADMGLVDLVQTFEAGRKSGVMRIELAGRADPGRVWFREGKVIDAEMGRWTGEAGFHRLLAATEGSFTIDFGPVDRQDRISLSSQGLLLEGVRRIDERGRLLEQIPKLDSVFELDYAAVADKLAKIPDEVNSLLRLIDGKRSLAEVIEEAPFDELATLGLVGKLYFEGLLRPPEARAAEAVQRDVARWADGGNATPAAPSTVPVAETATASPAPTADAGETAPREADEAPKKSTSEPAAWFAGPDDPSIAQKVAAVPEPAASVPAPAPAVAPVLLVEPGPVAAATTGAPAPNGAAIPVAPVHAEAAVPSFSDVTPAIPSNHGTRPLIVRFPSERRSERGKAPGSPDDALARSYFDRPTGASEDPFASPADAFAAGAPRQRSRIPLIAGGVVAAALLGVGLFAFVGQHPSVPGETAQPAAPKATTALPAVPPRAAAEVAAPAAPKPAPVPSPSPSVAAAPATRPTPAPTASAATTGVGTPAPIAPAAPRPAPAQPAVGASAAATPHAEAPTTAPAPPAAKAAPTEPESYRAALAAGEAKYRRGAIHGAITEFRKAVAAKPDSAVALAALGNALYEAGQTSAAVRPLKKALALDPRNARACLTLGTLYQTQSETVLAVQMYQRYLSIDPNGQFAGDVRTILKSLR